MKTHYFIATHIGPGATLLAQILHSQIKVAIVQRHKTYIYESPNQLSLLEEAPFRPYARNFVHFLYWNFSLSNKEFYPLCKFMYLLTPPKIVIPNLIEEHSYSPKGAYNYYCYRMRRLFEMSIKTPNKLIVTWDEMCSKAAFPSIKNFFKIKELAYSYKDLPDSDQSSIIDKAQGRYEFYLNKMRAI